MPRVSVYIHPVVFAMMESEEVKAVELELELGPGFASAPGVAAGAAASVGDVLGVLASRYGKPFVRTIFDPTTDQYNRYFMLVVNNTVVDVGEPGFSATPINEGDVIKLIPLYVGG